VPAPARRRLPLLIGAGALALAGLGGIGWWLTHRVAAPAGAVGTGVAGDSLDLSHIAVLYFEPRGGSDSLKYLSDGLTEALIRELSAVDGLTVISSNGVRPYRGDTVPLSQVANTLRVGTIVSGQVAQAGDSLRLTVSVTQGATGTQIGNVALTRPRGELFALQDDMSKEVATRLRAKLGGEIHVRETRATTRSLDAWSLYQRGLTETRDADTLAATGDTSGAMRTFLKADSILARAEAKDSVWPVPTVLRGWLVFRQSRMLETADPVAIDGGLAHAQRALALKPDDADALELRGTLRYWKWLNNLGRTPTESAKLLTDAEQDLRASVDQNPAQASAWTTLSHLLLNKPALGEAKLAAMRAYTADPYLTNANVTVWRLFVTSYQLDDQLEAKKWCDEGERRFPEDYRFAECRIWYYGLKQAKPDIPAMWEAYQRYVSLSPAALRPFNQLQGQMRVAVGLARAGKADSARHVAQRARADGSVDPSRDLAQIEAVAMDILGDKDEAFRLLSIWLASNPQQVGSASQDDTWELKDLRDDPRFAATFKRKK
jgi:TolB-like protein